MVYSGDDMLPENFRHLEMFDLEDAAIQLAKSDDPDWRKIAERLLIQIKARRDEEKAKADEAYRRRHEPSAQQQRDGETKL